ncbi:glycosyltransferase family 2 protein [Roseococcus pinisoli]|uniref:Glycosyltransferase n=1 Tax=Roseococcus pinisoli TaxID=2835040 RepID=A0ABS5Q7P9_9PROT|nr:glycosyltransferase [uncultured Roseococcus sp.]MBS7809432.1 glycosyltransferase [Roseococcus pinisoli]
MSRDVSVVIVAYNSAALLPACLAAIPPECPVVVVDNASPDDSALVALAARPGARVIRAERNLGFGPGANAGFAEVVTEFGLLLNADASLEPGAVAGLVAAARRYPGGAMFAPEIIAPDGRMQFGHDLPFRRLRGPVVEPSGDACCWYVGGSAMFLRMSAFRALGGFDPGIFLYFEDDDLCLRMRAAGHALIHVEGARVRHEGGASSAPSETLNWWKAFHQGWSRLHLEAKHHGQAAAWRLALSEAPGLGLKALFRRQDPRREKWSGRAAGMRAWITGRKATEIALGRRRQGPSGT